jgi:hypothetical protein
MIYKDGKSNFTIITSSNPSNLEKSAASELQFHLKKTGGVDMPITNDAAPEAKNEILLGRNARLKALNLGEDWQGLGRDGYVIRTVGSKLIIAGNTDRGTLNGVYAFLEDVLGVRWLTPETTYFPEVKELPLKKLNIRDVPAFDVRFLYSLNARNASWAARHRLNAFHDHANVRLGDIISDPRLEDAYTYAGQLGYTIYDLLCRALTPPGQEKIHTTEEVFKQHPEYFSEVNGKRTCKNAQLCLTNPEVPKLLAEGIKRLLKKEPGAKFVNVSMMDWTGQCRCASCKQAGSLSAVYFTAINKVAEIVEREYPDIWIEALAYHAEQVPPENIILRKNIIVKYAPIRMSYYYAMDEGKHNVEGGLVWICPPSATQIPRQLKKWTECAKNVSIWYYTLKLPMFHPNADLRPLSRNFRLMKEWGVKSVFVEDLNWVKEHQLNHLRAYLLAELMWNPDYDTAKGTEEFCRLYYGPACKEVLEYLGILISMDSWDVQEWKNGYGYMDGFQKKSFWEYTAPCSCWGWFNEKPGPEYYKERFFYLTWALNPPLKEIYFVKSKEIFENALKKVKGNKELEERIKVLRLPMYFAALVYLQGDNPLFKEAYSEFLPFVDKLVLENPALRAKIGIILPECVRKAAMGKKQ